MNIYGETCAIWLWGIKMTEERIFESIRSVLTADETLRGIVGARVYLDHVSRERGPEYPCISLFMLSSKARFECPEVVECSVQIDVWLPADSLDKEAAFTCAGRVRALLHRQKICQTGVTFISCIEAAVGPFMYERDANLMHLPLRYEVMAV